MQVYGTREGREKAGSGEGRRLALDSPVGGRLGGGLLPLLLETELVGFLGVLCVCLRTLYQEPKLDLGLLGGQGSLGVLPSTTP